MPWTRDGPRDSDQAYRRSSDAFADGTFNEWRSIKGMNTPTELSLMACQDRRPRGEVRDQYIHAVKVVPTLYDLLGTEPPQTLKGCPQNQIERETFKASLTNPGAPDTVPRDAGAVVDLGTKGGCLHLPATEGVGRLCLSWSASLFHAWWGWAKLTCGPAS